MKTGKLAEEAYARTHVPVRIHKMFFHETKTVNCRKRRRRNTALRTTARYILESSEKYPPMNTLFIYIWCRQTH